MTEADDAPMMPKLMCPAWVDDLALPLIGTVEEICDMAINTFEIVHECFWQHKLFLNMKPGKTAFMPMLAGKM